MSASKSGFLQGEAAIFYSRALVYQLIGQQIKNGGIIVLHSQSRAISPPFESAGNLHSLVCVNRDLIERHCLFF